MRRYICCPFRHGTDGCLSSICRYCVFFCISRYLPISALTRLLSGPSMSIIRISYGYMVKNLPGSQPVFLRQSERSLLPKMHGLNRRQIEILTVFNVTPNKIMTVKEVQNRFGVSDPTARQDLVSLVEKGFLTEIEINKVKKRICKSEFSAEGGKKN